MLDSGRLTLATACQFSALPNSSQEEIAAYLNRDSERKFTVEQANTLADLKFFSESDISGFAERRKPWENLHQNALNRLKTALLQSQNRP